MAITIKDVAKRCGMSISTISKVFNGYSDISQETRSQVMKVAREMGYQPNPLARALKTNRTYNLGVLLADDNVSGLMHPFFAAVLNAFKIAAEAHGYDITFINHNVGNVETTYLEHCRRRNLDGVCLACVDFYAPEIAELVYSDIPTVTVDHMFAGHACVFSDNYAGMRMLVDRAASLGHTKIAYIHGQRNSLVTDKRIESYLKGMRAHGFEVPDGYIVDGRYDDAMSAARNTRMLLDRSDRPTCILLPDDASWLGALEVARSYGLRVPEDISFAGYDGIKLTQSLHPRLTTIQQDSDAMGRAAARLLIDQIERRTAGNIVTPTTVPVRLLEGETIAPVPVLQVC